MTNRVILPKKSLINTKVTLCIENKYYFVVIFM